MIHIGCRREDLMKTIREYEDKGFIYYNHVVDSFGCTTVWFKKLEEEHIKFKRIQDRLESYYIQQKNNKYIDDDVKRVIRKVIEECQRIVAEEETRDE